MPPAFALVPTAAALRPGRDRAVAVAWAGGGTAAVTAVGVVVGSAGLAAVAALVVTVAAVARRRRRRRRRRTAELARILAVCDALGGLLRAGLPLAVAEQRVLAGPADGGGPAVLPAAVATCLAVGARSGAAVADVLAALATDVRSDLTLQREIAGAMAPARLSGMMLAGLPVLGVLVAASLGAAPGHVLLGTRAGSACLLAAVVLEATGLAWLDRIARRAEASC